jgi:hypothetical protein
VEVVYDGVVDVRLQKPLHVARDGAKRVAQAIEAPFDEVVRDEPRDVRALTRLMIKRD